MTVNKATKETCISGTGVKGDAIKLWKMKLERKNGEKS